MFHKVTLNLRIVGQILKTEKSLLVIRILQVLFPNMIPIHIRTPIVLAHVSKINYCT